MKATLEFDMSNPSDSHMHVLCSNGRELAYVIHTIISMYENMSDDIVGVSPKTVAHSIKQIIECEGLDEAMCSYHDLRNYFNE